MRPPVWLTLLVACSLLVPFPVVLHAAATVVQHVTDATAGWSSTTISFGSNVTTGNAVIVAVTQYAGSGTAFTYSDATNGAYTSHIDLPWATYGGYIGSKRNLTGGFTTVTLAANTGSDNSAGYDAWEVSGLDNSLAVLTGTHGPEVSGAMSHPCSDTGLTGTGFIVCAGMQFPDTGGQTPPTSWTNEHTDNDTVVFRHIGTFSGEVGTWSHPGTAQTATGMALWRETAAATGPPVGSLSLLGVGK